MTKLQIQFHQRKTAFSNKQCYNRWTPTGKKRGEKKKDVNLGLTSYLENTSKGITDLNINVKLQTFRGKKKRTKIFRIQGEEEFLDLTTKAIKMSY